MSLSLFKCRCWIELGESEHTLHRWCNPSSVCRRLWWDLWLLLKVKLHRGSCHDIVKIVSRWWVGKSTKSVLVQASSSHVWVVWLCLFWWQGRWLWSWNLGFFQFRFGKWSSISWYSMKKDYYTDVVFGDQLALGTNWRRLYDCIYATMFVWIKM